MKTGAVTAVVLAAAVALVVADTLNFDNTPVGQAPAPQVSCAEMRRKGKGFE
jgi:hypothetical protein